MDEDVLVHELVNSLAFEVEAIATENVVKFTSANGTPLNVKVRLRNKDEPRLVQRGLVSVPKLGKHITTPARIISSDQTILSFNVLMETELERPTPKNRKHGFNFLKLSCLGTSADEDEGPYLPDTSNKKDLRSKTSSKSDSAIINESAAAPQAKLNLGTSNAVAKNQGGLFGKCKPGGCLDPPFSEDKYSYGLPKTQPHVKLKNTLNLAEDGKENRNISIHSDEPGIAAKAANEPPKNVENLKKHEIDTKPLLNIFTRTNSLQNSQTSNHSNSIITYPPELSSSEMISSDQNARKRSRSKTFSDGSPKQSYEYPESYFIPPKDVRQKEEERRYSRELSNDQIGFNDRNRNETSQNKGNQRKSLINDIFDPDINTTKYLGTKTIPQSGKGSKEKDKNNKEVIKQTLTYLTLENKDKPRKLCATQQKNTITLLETPTTQLNKKSPSLILTGSKNFDNSNEVSKSPIEKSQEDEQPQTKLRSNIQQPSVIDHLTPDLAANLQNTQKKEKFRMVKSEIPDNTDLAKDITNKNLSRYVETQGNIGPMQEQASDVNEIKPQLGETKDLRPSAIFKNGIEEDKLQKLEPSPDSSDLNISFEEKRLMMPSAKPIKTEINQTFGQDDGPTELSLGTKLLKSSLPNLLDNHALNVTAIPDVTCIKDEQTNANKQLENHPNKSLDKVTIRTSSQITPIEKKPQLQITDSPVCIGEKNNDKDFNPLRSDTNAEIRKETKAFETQYKKTSEYPSDDSSLTKGKSDANRVRELPKNSTIIETIQQKVLDGADFVGIQDNDSKERSVVSGPKNKFTKHSSTTETLNKQVGDIQNQDLDNHQLRMSTNVTETKDVPKNLVNLPTSNNQILDTQDHKGEPNAVNLNKNKVIGTKPIGKSLQDPENGTNERIAKTRDIQDDYLNDDDDKDTIILKTTSDATGIPSKSPNATENLTKDGLSSINKTKPIQTVTSEKHLDDYTSKVRPIDATIISSKSSNVKGVFQEPVEDTKNIKEDGLSILNTTKPFLTDTKKKYLTTAKIQPEESTIPAENTNDIIQKPVLNSKDTKTMIVQEDGLPIFNEPNPFSTDSKKQDLDNYSLQAHLKDDTMIPSKTINVQQIIQEPLADSRDTKHMEVKGDVLSSLNESESFSADSKKQQLDMYTPKSQPINATSTPYKSTNVKEIIQDPLIDNKDSTNIKVFQKDTKEQDLATLKGRPITPAKNTPVQDIIQKPALDSKNTKNVIENEDGLSSYNEAKSFQTDTKKPDINIHTSEIQPLNNTMLPAKVTNVKNISQEALVDSKDPEHINVNEDGLFTFHEAKPFQEDTERQDLDNQISQTRPKKNVKKLNLNQMPRNLFKHDIISSENKEYAISSTPSIDSYYDNDDYHGKEQENNKDYKVQKLTPKNENHVDVDNFIVQNDLLHDQDKILNLEPREKNTSLQKSPSTATDEADLINKINSLNPKTLTTKTSIEKQLAKTSSQQNVIDEYARTKIDSKHVPHGQIPNSIEDLDELNRKLVYPDPAMDFSRKPEQNNDFLNAFDETTSVILNQLTKTDNENQNDSKDTDSQNILGFKYEIIESSGSNPNKIYQESLRLPENQENVTLSLDKLLYKMDDDFSGQKSIKGLDDSGENVFSKHMNLDLDKEKTATDKKISIDTSKNELKIASGHESGRTLEDKNERFDSTPNFVDEVLSYRSKTSETGKRISHNYENQPLDPSSQIPVNIDTLSTLNEAYAGISSVDIGPQVKNVDDISEKAPALSPYVTGVSGPIEKKALPLLGEAVDEVDEIMNVKNKSNQIDHENFREGSIKEIDYTPQNVTKHYGLYDPIEKVPISTNYTNDGRFLGIDSGMIEGLPQDVTNRSGKYDPLSKVSAAKNDTNDNGLPKAKTNLNSNVYSDSLTEQIESTTFNQKFGSMSRNEFQNEPSRISIENEKSAALLLNMSFQSYVNENGETIVRTFHPLEEPPRYADDKITVVNSFIRPGNEIRIPVSPDHDLALNLLCRKNNAPDNFNIRKNYKTNASLSEHVELAARQRDDVLDKALALIYERELIPLHNIMKDLTEEIKSLSGQQEHKGKLLGVKRTRSLRLIPVNNRCGCKRN